MFDNVKYMITLSTLPEPEINLSMTLKIIENL